MKTILLPIDFSLPAKNAGHYAMHLAKEMRANIKLCYAVMLPIEVPLAGHVSVPLVAIDTLQREAEERLRLTAEKMMELDQLDTEIDTYHPKVTQGTGIGSVTDVVTSFATDNDICLVVMGMTGSGGGLSRFLLGSSSKAMVEEATFPILLVPSETRFIKLRKIAFATDLSQGDIGIIHTLAGFARVFNAQILLVHISDHAPGSQVSSKVKIEMFLNEVTNKVNYHKIYYQHVLEDEIDDGLDWLAKYGQIQMLAMVHRKRDVFHRIFKGSHTQRVRRKIEIPLMVFPSDCQSKVV